MGVDKDISRENKNHYTNTKERKTIMGRNRLSVLEKLERKLVRLQAEIEEVKSEISLQSVEIPANDNPEKIKKED